MEFLTRDICQSCKGIGIISNLLYELFDIDEKAYKLQHNGEPMTIKLFEKWFRNRGYHTPPPEEFTCGDCAGTGTIEKWIDIKDIKRFLEAEPESSNK